MKKIPKRNYATRFTTGFGIAVAIVALIFGAIGVSKVSLSSVSSGTVVPHTSITPAPFLWNVTWGGAGIDQGYSVWGDGTRLFMTGWTTSFGAGDYDFALVAFDQFTGARLWNVTWGWVGDDEAYSVWGDGTRVFTAGWTTSLGLGDNDFALVAWDETTGARLWNVSWGGIGDDEAYSVWGDGTRVYMAGWTNSYGAGSYDGALVAFNETTGARLWNVTWGGTNPDFFSSVWGDGARIYTAGYTSSYSLGSYDFALVAWDPVTGARLWDSTWGGVGNDEANSVWGDGTRIYTVGYTMSFGSGATDFALVAWDPTTGARLWNTTWGGASDESGLGVWGDGSRVYTAGNTVSFSIGIRSFALVAWDPASGAFLWSDIWGGSSDDEAYSVWGDGTRLYTAGYVYSFGLGSADYALVAWDVHFTVSHPGDFTYQVDTTGHKVQWDVSSATTNTGTYSVFSNGILYTSGTWTSNQDIIFPVDNFTVGTYILTLNAVDGFGAQVTDTVIFTVTATPSATLPTSWGISDTLLLIFLGIACALFVIAIRYRPYRSLPITRDASSLKNQPPNTEPSRASEKSTVASKK